MKIFNQIQMLRKVYSTLLDEIASKYELNECEIMILVFLNETSEENMASDIVKHLMISKAHVSGLVNNLENQGYIIRQKDQKDKKKIHLTITEKAKPIIKEVQKKKKEMKVKVFDGVTEAEVEVMKTVLSKIRNNLKNNYDIKLKQK